MKKILLLAAMFALMPFCKAGTVKGDVKPESNEVTEKVYYTKPNYAFAFTEETLDKAIKIISQGDKVAFKKMVDSNQIFLTGKNVEVYLVKSGFTKIKIRPKGNTTEFWTVSEAISDKPVY